MSTDSSDRFRCRIAEELNRLPLTSEQKAAIIPKLLRYTTFLDTDGGTKKTGHVRTDSTLFDFETKITEVVRRFAADGLTRDAYLQAAVKQPQIFQQKPATIVANITVVAEQFAAEGLTVRSYLQAALKRPTIFCQSVRAAVTNIRGVAEHFAGEGLTVRDYLQVALEQPSLFRSASDTVVANIRGVAKLFASEGLTIEAYLQAARERPSLLLYRPDAIAGNIMGVVERFACDGLTARQYVRAALKRPQLFYQKPTTIARHIALYFRMFDDGVFAVPIPRREKQTHGSCVTPHATVLAFLLRYPVLLCRDDGNLQLRRVYKQISKNAPSSHDILFSSRARIEREVLRHFGHSDFARPVGKDANPTLRELIRNGCIKSVGLEA